MSDPADLQATATAGGAADDGAGGRQSQSGLLPAFGRLLAAAFEHLSARAELALLDLEDAIESLAGMLLWAVVAIVAAAMTLFTGALALVFIFWDTHRVLVSVLMVAAFAAIGCIAALAALLSVRRQRGLFTATLAQFARDRHHARAGHEP